MGIGKVFVLAFECVALIVGCGAAQAADQSFFKGKQIRLIVGTDPGGGYDDYARTLAPYLAKHLPGQPSIVVENMVGAAGLVTANYVYNAAPRDGTVLATFPNAAPFAPVMGERGARFRPAEFGWLGSMTTESTVCVSSAKSGIKNVSDLMHHPLTVGGSGPNNSETLPAVLNYVLGVKFKIIPGYPSSTAASLALERGEVDGLCTGYSTIATHYPDWLKDRKVNLLVQAGLRINPKMQNVPLAINLAKNPEDRQVLELNDAPLELGRPFVAPPGLPPARLKSLRQAFNAALRDPGLMRAIEKRRLELNPVDGEAAQALLVKFAATPRAIIDRLRTALKNEPDRRKR